MTYRLPSSVHSFRGHRNDSETDFLSQHRCLSARSTLAPLSQRGLHRHQTSSHHNSHLLTPRSAPIVNLHDASTSARGNVFDQSEDEENEDNLNQVVMAIDMKANGTIGCSYYVAREEKLYVMQDVKLGVASMIEMLKIQIEPTTVIVSTRLEDQPLSFLEQNVNDGSSTIEDEQFRLPYIIETRPSTEFSYESAKDKLLELELFHENNLQFRFRAPDFVGSDFQLDPSMDDGFTDRQGKLLRLSIIVDLENIVSVGCTGAILHCLTRKRASIYLPGDVTANYLFKITTIEMFNIRQSMYINADSISSLQILPVRPPLHMRTQRSSKSSVAPKENLSVLGIFSRHAHTPQGKILLKRMFLRPSFDINLIEERLNTLSVFLAPENNDVLKDLEKWLRGVKDIRRVMAHLRKGLSVESSTRGTIRSGVWGTLQAFVYYSLRILDVFGQSVGKEGLAIYAKIVETVKSIQFGQIGRMISLVVDFVASEEEGRIVIQPGISGELDEMKKSCLYLKTVLDDATTSIIEDLRPFFANVQVRVVFMKQHGFLAVLPLAARFLYERCLQELRWEKISNTESQVYFRNPRTTELDAQFGDMYGRICDKEIEVIHLLAQDVIGYEDLLCNASDALAELDSLVALALGAKAQNYVRPQMTDRNIIQIDGGRHPLQELIVPLFVANDTNLVGGEGLSETASPGKDPSILIMAGPNYSGKSIYLKQVALIVYMAHIGSFVPANKATIGLTDKILTRVTTRESIAKTQSAFMLDLQQIAFALSLSTRRSLLIIDEFGKGTDLSNGAGLACGVFDHILNRGAECPKVLGATHFHEIFESNLLSPRSGLLIGHMEVEINLSAQEVDYQFSFLYKFREGRSRESFGTMCAAINGIDATIVDRANELVRLQARGEDLAEICKTTSRVEEARFQDLVVLARNFMSLEIDVEDDVNYYQILDRLWSDDDNCYDSELTSNDESSSPA